MLTNLRRKALVWFMAALFAAVSLLGASPGYAAKLITVGATGSQPNVPVTALRNWPVTAGLYPHDPVVTETMVLNYPASLGFWPNMPMGKSVEIGADRLGQMIADTPGNLIVFDESQGSLVSTVLKQRWAADPSSAQDVGRVIFVHVGNPGTAGTGFSARNPGYKDPALQITLPGATPDGPYGTINVTRQYDFFADTPEGGNMLAELNRWAGFALIHPNYGDVDMNSPDNLIKVVNNTTYVLVPTERLPMLQSMYGMAEAWKRLTGQSQWLREVDALNTRLKAVIEKAYDRSGYVRAGDMPKAPLQDPEEMTLQDEEPQAAIESQAVVSSESTESFTAPSGGSAARQSFTTVGELNPVQSSDPNEVKVEETKTEEPVEQVVSEPVVETPVVTTPDPEPQAPTSPSPNVSDEQVVDNDEQAPKLGSADEADDTVKKPARKSGSGVKIAVAKAHEATRPNADKVGASAPSAPSGAAGDSSPSTPSGNDD